VALKEAFWEDFRLARWFDPQLELAGWFDDEVADENVVIRTAAGELTLSEKSYASIEDVYAEALGNSTTTSTSVGGANKVRLTHTPRDNERWWYFWHTVMSNSSITEDGLMRFRNATLGVDWSNANIEQPDTVSDFGLAGAKEHTYGSSPGSQDIDIDFWSEAGSTVTLANTAIWGYPPSSLDHAAANDVEVGNTGANIWELGVSFNESLTGTYAIFCFAEYRVGTGTCRIRANHDGSIFGRRDQIAIDTTNWGTWSTVFVVEDLNGSSQPINIQFQSSSGTADNVQLRNCRIFALNLDQFAQAQYDQDPDLTSTTSSSYQTKSTVALTPLATRPHIAFGSMVLNKDDALSSNSVLARFFAGSTVSEIRSDQDNDAEQYCLFGFQRSSPGSLTTFQTQYRRIGSVVISAEAKESTVLVVDLATRSGVSVEPEVSLDSAVPAGSLTADGPLPTVIVTTVVTVADGVLTLTGFALTSALGPFTVTPEAGALSLTGFVPTAALGPLTVVPDAGALSLTGFVPVLARAYAATVANGALTFTGFVPALARSYATTVPNGALTFTGFASASLIGSVISVPDGALSLTGFAAALARAYATTVPVGTLSLTGFAPPLDRIITTPNGVLSLTGFAPALARSYSTTVPNGALTFTGFSPAAINNQSVNVPNGALTFTGFSPALLRAYATTVPNGQLTANGFAPNLVRADVLTVPTALLTFGGWDPAALNTVQVNPGDGALSLTAFAAELRRSFAGEPTTGQLTASGHVPTQLQSLLINVPEAFMSCGAEPPLLSLQIIVPPGALTATGFRPQELTEIIIPDGALILTGLAPTQRFQVNVNAGQLTLVGQEPDVKQALTVPPGALTVTQSSPHLDTPILVPTGLLSLLGFEAGFAQFIRVAEGLLVLEGKEATLFISFPTFSIDLGSVFLTGPVSVNAQRGMVELLVADRLSISNLEGKRARDTQLVAQLVRTTQA
jgi:hypothetical protein